VQRKTRRHFVPAEFVELLRSSSKLPPGSSLQCFVRFLTDSVLVEADHDGWSMIPSSDPRCYNAALDASRALQPRWPRRAPLRADPIFLSPHRKFVFPLPGARDLLVELGCEHCCLAVIEK
jgi:hypothetical protein